MKVSHEEAERIAGTKLDRRRNWFLFDGEICFDAKWTGPCSGCSCDFEYPCSCCRESGAGCDECGYTGKRVNRFPVPHWVLEQEKNQKSKPQYDRAAVLGER